MKKLIIFFILLILSILAGVQLAKDPGYVLIAMHQTSFEMPLWFAALLAIAVIIIAYWLLRLLTVMGTLRRRWGAWQRLRQYKRVLRTLQKGTYYLARKRWHLAERTFQQATTTEEAQSVANLGAAIAAQQQHADHRRDAYLAQVTHLSTKVLRQLMQSFGSSA